MMKGQYLLTITAWLKKRRIFVFTVIVAYFFFLLINLPASVVISTLELPRNIKVTGISGSAWSGKIHNLNISGVNLGSVSWQMQPAYLLLGAVSADILIVKDQQMIKSWLKLSPSGKVELEETRFKINLSSLQPLIYGMPFSYGGMASGYFPVSQFYKNKYVALNGKLSLTNLEMLTPQRQAFGGLELDFRAEKDGMTTARIKDNGEQLAVSGSLTINKAGLLKLSAKLAAHQKGSQLDNVVSFLGPKDAAGKVLVNNQFKIWQ
jgi:general secretion pathway protein N